MSNIYEALKRAESENADQAEPLVTDELAQTKAVVSSVSGAAPKVVDVDVSPEAFDPPALPENPPVTEPLNPPIPEEAVTYGRDGIRSVRIRVAAGVPILPFDGSDPGASEQYRILRTKFIQHPRQPRLCVITSPGPGDGKTITAINLAGGLALRSEAKVVLVDGDLRRSNIAAVLGLPDGPGLAELLAGTSELEDVLLRVEQLQNLYIIPAGKPCANPTELLDSPRWSSTTNRLREIFRFAILDVPPIAAVADYDLIQAQADGALMVVRQDHTNRSRCFKAMDMIPKEKRIGIVLNCVADWFLWKTSTYSYYDATRSSRHFKG